MARIEGMPLAEMPMPDTPPSLPPLALEPMPAADGLSLTFVDPDVASSHPSTRPDLRPYEWSEGPFRWPTPPFAAYPLAERAAGA